MSFKIDMSICRVCLQPGNAVNIYTGDILEKFVYMTLVQVDKDDGLSEILCKKCLPRLRIAFEFKKQAESSDRNLRSFISDVNRKFKQVTGTKSSNIPNKNKRAWTKMEEINYTDELEDDIEGLLNDDDDAATYMTYETDRTADDKQTIPREQLVEILGERSSIVRKVSSKQFETYIDETSYNEPQQMEEFLVDENYVEDGYIVEGVEIDEYDENMSELAAEESEPQYLDSDGNDDGLKSDMQEAKPIRLSRSNLAPASANPTNLCSVCNKTFSTRTNLTRHMITHEGRKPYVCHICSNSFTQKGSLNHIWEYIHTGERPFQCSECPKAFTQSKSLTFHMRRHTGEKPFTCDHCGVKFRQKDGLKRHIAAKHQIPIQKGKFTCDICNKECSSRSSLNAHRAKHDKWNQKDVDLISDEDDVFAEIKGENDKGNEHSEMKEVWEDHMFACEFCDDVFSTMDGMLQHRLIHDEANEDNLN